VSAPVATASAPPDAGDTRAGRDRPYGLHVPAHADGRLPLVLFFHGYGSSGASSARAYDLEEFADAHGFVLAFPDGTIDSRGRRFWNATDACCDFDRRGVDDVAYVGNVIDEISARIPIDAKRVYAIGHSNGGFLAQRLACDLAPRIAATVSLAGAGWKDRDRCRPTQPVSVLEIAGDADDVIRPQGGRVFDLPVPEYPPVRETVAAWAARDGCLGPPVRAGASIDLDARVPGAETTPLAYRCPRGIAVELWTVAGGSHIFALSRPGLESIWRWMSARARP